jgi:hypothetical protein
MPMTSRMQQHGHNGPQDGGKLNAVGFRAASVNQTTITCNAFVAVAYSNELWDSNNWYNNGTYTYTPLQAGKYFVNARMRMNGSGITSGIIYIFKNGTEAASMTFPPTGTLNAFTMVSDVVDMNGTTDNLSVTVYVAATSGCQYGTTSGNTNFFSAIRVSN